MNAALSDVGILGLGTANQTGTIYVLGDVSAAGLQTGSSNYDIQIGRPAMALDYIQITADNGYTAYLNGSLLGSSGDWSSPRKYTLPASAVNGTNVFAVAAYDAGGIASMQAEIKLQDGTVFGTDGTWKWTISNPTANAGWNTVGFNDAGWSSNGSEIGRAHV